MFLKVMHNGADEFLANATSEATYSLYSDVVSCHFLRYKTPTPPPEGATQITFGMATIYCREPIKTADMPGYAEVQKNVELTGDAFLMNDQGRTISKFQIWPLGRPVEKTYPTPEFEEAVAIRLLQEMPYDVAAAIRTVAGQSGSVSGAVLLSLLNKANVAMDEVVRLNPLS